MKNKAVIYARYSSHNQREESIEGQLRECHEYADKNNLVVIKEYCDRAISGKTDNRPMFQQLIEDSNKKEFEVVLMYTLDRFARNRYDSAVYKNKLKKNGVKVIYVKQPMPDTPEGIILESVLEGYAEYYSENLSRNIKRGMTENANQLLFNGGPVPLGYKIVDKKYVIDPIGAKIVNEIYEMYDKNYSLVKIMEVLNEKGYKSARNKPFGKGSLTAILNNDLYGGYYTYNGEKTPNGVPQIVPDKLFNSVRRIIANNKVVRAKKSASVPYILTGKLFCGKCGEPMVGDSAYGRKNFYSYYTCRNRKKNHTCDKATIKRVEIEKFVTDYILKELLSDENVKVLVDNIMKLINNQKEDNYIVALRQELKEVDRQLNNVINAIASGMDNPRLKAKMEELQDEYDRLSLEIAESSRKIPQLSREHVEYFLYSLKTEGTDDPEHQKKLISTFVNAIYAFDDHIVIVFNVSGDNEEIKVNVSDINQNRHHVEYSRNNYIFKGKLVCVLKMTPNE